MHVNTSHDPPQSRDDAVLLCRLVWHICYLSAGSAEELVRPTEVARWCRLETLSTPRIDGDQYEITDFESIVCYASAYDHFSERVSIPDAIAKAIKDVNSGFLAENHQG